MKFNNCCWHSASPIPPHSLPRLTPSAAPLLGSPLRLRLLHRVVKREGRWPGSRYALFAEAVQSLVHEHNDDYKFSARSGPDRIIAAAELASLVMLVTGARAIWRSNGEPPQTPGDERALLPAHTLRLTNELVADMLDTALFTGEGEAFEAIHRAIAEFLAGRALANAIRGDRSHAAFPLSRALAFITAPDAVPPAELRGVYAWLACHLSQSGDGPRAIQLIQKDAATVLFYGDAASLRTAQRRVLLQHLDQLDPYFHTTETHDSPIASLAQPDLLPELRQILLAPTAESHLFLTVIEALTAADPLPTLHPVLAEIVKDPARPEWQRVRAADAWLNAPGASAKMLFAELDPEPPSTSREAVRIHLATKFAEDLSTQHIRGLLSDFERTPEDNTVGRLTVFAQAVGASPAVLELFDVPLTTWLKREEGRLHHSVELENAIDAFLASAISQAADLPAQRVWNWINNVRGGVWHDVRESTRVAVAAWLDEKPSREAEFFDVILEDPGTQEIPAQPVNAFAFTVGRLPSDDLARTLLQRAAEARDATRLHAIAVEIARRAPDSVLYGEMQSHLASNRPANDALLERLQSARAEREEQKRESQPNRRQEDTNKAKASNDRILTPLLAELRSGRQAHHLSWAAEIYFSRPRANPGGNMPRLEELLAGQVLDAVLEGWDHLCSHDLPDVSPESLAKAEAENTRFYVEYPVLAGLHRRLIAGTLASLNEAPLTAALIVLRLSSTIGVIAHRKRMVRHEIGMFAHHPGGDLTDRDQVQYNCLLCSTINQEVSLAH